MNNYYKFNVDQYSVGGKEWNARFVLLLDALDYAEILINRDQWSDHVNVSDVDRNVLVRFE